MAECFDSLYFYKGIQLIQAAIRQTNAFYQYHAPWTHVDADGKPRSEEDKRKLDTTIHVTYQTMRLCGLLLQPIVPNVAGRLLNRLGIPDDERSFRFCEVFRNCPVSVDNRPLGDEKAMGKALFSRLKIVEK